MKQPVRVWDVPTRLFHWLLVLSISGSFASGLAAGGWLVWHERLGIFALMLLLFRLAWGFIGARTSRFTDFVRGPSAIVRYLKTGVNPTHGHSPLGALAVLALLGVLFLQAATGLIVDDDIATKGPLADKAPAAWVALATKIHRINKWILGALIVLHLAAIVFYTFVKKESLVKPMISGFREVESNDVRLPLAPSSRGLAALVLACVVAAFVYWLTQRFARS